MTAPLSDQDIERVLKGEGVMLRRVPIWRHVWHLISGQHHVVPLYRIDDDGLHMKGFVCDTCGREL